MKNRDWILAWAFGHDKPGIEEILKENRGLVIMLPNGPWMVKPGFCVECDPRYRRNLPLEQYFSLADQCRHRDRYDHRIGMSLLTADSVGFSIGEPGHRRIEWILREWPESRRHARLIEELRAAGKMP